MDSLISQFSQVIGIFSQFSYVSWGILIVSFLILALFNRIFILSLFEFLRKRAGLGERSRAFKFIYPIKRSIFWFLLSVGVGVIPYLLTFTSGEILLLARLRNLALILTLFTYGLSFIRNLKELMENSEEEIIDQVGILIRFVLKLLLWSFAILATLYYVFGVNVTTWLAGLGILGLGVSLALQDTFRNFFGSLVIITDKPFKEGERIVFEGMDGVVEKIGMRTTRIRTLDGHMITLPNSKLADGNVDNMSLRPYFKRVINIGVTYDTPATKIEKAVLILKEILAEKEENLPLYQNTELLPKVFFKDFGDFSLNILVIYWYTPSDNYWAYLEHVQKINLEILHRFEEAGIDFAFPTQTLYLAGDSKRELKVHSEFKTPDP